jgi:hypothetical protein
MGDSGKQRSRLYVASTFTTLTVAALIFYLVLYVANAFWAFFVLDPSVAGRSVSSPLDHRDVFLLAWFVASAAAAATTAGGGLGSGLESDDTIRAAGVLQA